MKCRMRFGRFGKRPGSGGKPVSGKPEASGATSSRQRRSTSRYLETPANFAAPMVGENNGGPISAPGAIRRTASRIG
jgi:hypothetical protein